MQRLMELNNTAGEMKSIQQHLVQVKPVESAKELLQQANELVEKAISLQQQEIQNEVQMPR